MRILKSKIARALLRQQSSDNEHKANMNTQAKKTVQNLDESSRRQLRTRVAQPSLPQILTPKGSTSCKNVMKNYSRALAIFALSPLALPYLLPLLQKHKLQLPSFVEFVQLQKKAANCIKGLRDHLLLVKDSDSDQVSTMKQIFQEICVVFLKFFCVNWIFHGKVVDKTAHLSYRLKLLRKVRNPASFNYLEDIH